jgi:hypothetical protein
VNISSKLFAKQYLLILMIIFLPANRADALGFIAGLTRRDIMKRYLVVFIILLIALCNSSKGELMAAETKHGC